MRNATRCTVRGLVTVALLSTSAGRVQAQQEEEARQIYDDGGVWVYASFFEIQWPRVDSLIKLNSVSPAVREKARELGCYLDNRMLIHHTGTERNVVFLTYYANWDDMSPGSDCGDRAFQAVVPDSMLRAAMNEGFEWVFEGQTHRDIIYWEAYPNKER